jgi:uncharacterized protein YceK
MKKLILVSLLVVSIFLIGCGTNQTTIIADQGDVQIEASGFDSDNWCQAGAEWKMTGDFDEGETNAQWNIEGLMTSGEFEGLCHVIYTTQTPEGETQMDYYFSEDGETGYFEMDINGQKFTQEWHS